MKSAEVLPARHIEDAVRYLAARTNVEFLRYDDLLFDDDVDADNAYPYEFLRWRTARDPEKVYVLCQYDVDLLPQNTMRQLAVHRELGVPATVMLFAVPQLERADSYHGALTEIVTGGYPESIVTVGYHSNAYERSGFSVDRWVSRFCEDVGFLTSQYRDIQFWSPHGGARDAHGKSNAHYLETPSWLRAGLRQIHNGRTVRFAATYSDGGLLNPGYTVGRDLRAFVAAMVPGHRYRILLHPQYYGAGELEPCALLAGQDWYEETIAKGGAW